MLDNLAHLESLRDQQMVFDKWQDWLDLGFQETGTEQEAIEKKWQLEFEKSLWLIKQKREAGVEFPDLPPTHPKSEPRVVDLAEKLEAMQTYRKEWWALSDKRPKKERKTLKSFYQP